MCALFVYSKSCCLFFWTLAELKLMQTFMCLSLKLPTYFLLFMCLSVLYFLFFFPFLRYVCVCVFNYVSSFICSEVFTFSLLFKAQPRDYNIHPSWLMSNIHVYSGPFPGQYKHLRKIEIRSFSPQISLQSYLSYSYSILNETRC